MTIGVDPDRMTILNPSTTLVVLARLIRIQNDACLGLGQWRFRVSRVHRFLCVLCVLFASSIGINIISICESDIFSQQLPYRTREVQLHVLCFKMRSSRVSLRRQRSFTKKTKWFHFFQCCCHSFTLGTYPV
jgi:hypothetical protein